MVPVRRFLDDVDKVAQVQRGVEFGLTGLAGANSLAELVVHLPHVVRRPSRHPFQHVGVLFWDLQVF